MDELAAALGSGALTPHQLAPKLLPAEPAQPTAAPGVSGVTSSVMVMGMPNFLTRLADCCHPVNGDRIVGFVTRSRGVTVHREGCRNMHAKEHPDRLIPVSWGTPSQHYTARISIEAWDRVGLLSDVASLLAAERVNIAAVRSAHQRKGTVTEMLTLETFGASQLSRLLSRIENVRGVIRVERKG